MRVVRAEPDDAFVVAALTLQLSRDVGAPTEPGFLDRAAAAWLAAPNPTWIAEREGAHAGFAQGGFLPDLVWPGIPAGSRRRFWLTAVFVAPDHRRRGVATALVQQAEAWARHEGAVVVRLRADPPAQDFWVSLGYARNDELRERRLD